MSDEWRERDRPPRLERRYQFDSYDALRDFLDLAADLSEKEGYYPDMGFGRDYVNITIHVEDGQSELADSQRKLASELDKLFDQQTH
ncbi:MAG: 4a-hydroxytetrahydrobiopterin dehydratase [bacterium]